MASTPDQKVEAVIRTLLVAAIINFTGSVTDGDTVTIAGERIRIANIDTPEIHHAQCEAERRLGKVAARRLAELLKSGRIEVHVGDPGTGRKKDRYGRTLATISIDGMDVGETLIIEDLARPWEGRRRSWCD